MHILAPLGRVLISLIFLFSGINKIFTYEGTLQYMESMNVSGVLLPPTIALEIIGAIAIIVGWHARKAAGALALFCLISAIIFHSNISDQTQMALFMKNISIIGGFLFIIAFGPGPLSINKK